MQGGNTIRYIYTLENDESTNCGVSSCNQRVALVDLGDQCVIDMTRVLFVRLSADAINH